MKKWNCCGLITVMLIFSIFLSGCGTADVTIPHPIISLPGGETDIPVNLDSASLQNTGNTQAVYEMIVPSVEELTLQIGSVATLSDAETSWVAGENKFYSFEDGSVVTLDESLGFWSYSQVTNYSSDIMLPSDDEAKMIACEYIEETGLFDDVNIDELIVSYSTTGLDVEAGGERVIEKTVSYFPTVNDMPVYGLYRVAVTIGDQGTIIGVLKQANPVNYVGDVVVKTESEIVEDVVKKNYSLNYSGVQCDELVAEEGYEAYYCDAYSPFLLPTYVISGATEEGSGESTFDLILDYQPES